VDFAVILPNDMVPSIAIFLVFMSFVTSFITAAFGIGGGAIILAVLAVSVPAVALIPIHGVVQLGSNAGRVGLMMKDVVWRPTLPFIAGSLLGASIGGALAVQIPTAIVQIAVGLFIVFIVLVKLPPIAMRYVFAGGLVSSFLTMFFGATGNFIAAMVKSMQLDPLSHVATHSVMMTIQHLIKVIVFGIVGFNFAAYLPIISGMLISGFVGTFIGKQFLVKSGHAYFKPILNGVLLFVAAHLIWTGASLILASA